MKIMDLKLAKKARQQAKQNKGKSILFLCSRINGKYKNYVMPKQEKKLREFGSMCLFG